MRTWEEISAVGGSRACDYAPDRSWIAPHEIAWNEPLRVAEKTVANQAESSNSMQAQARSVDEPPRSDQVRKDHGYEDVPPGEAGADQAKGEAAASEKHSPFAGGGAQGGPRRPRQ